MTDGRASTPGPDATKDGSAAVLGTPTPDDRPVLVRLVVLAALVAALLIGGITYAAGHGILPARVLLGLDGNLLAPQTTNPATTAPGSEPVYRSICEFVATNAGAQCVFSLSDERGNLVEQGLAVPVPRTWLARIHRGTAVDDMQVIAALVRAPYSPPDGPGLESMNISVDPTYAALLSTVGVTPQAFLEWLYHNVPPAHRPPWVD